MIMLFLVVLISSIVGVLLSVYILCKFDAIPTDPLPKWLHPWRKKDEE